MKWGTENKHFTHLSFTRHRQPQHPGHEWTAARRCRAWGWATISQTAGLSPLPPQTPGTSPKLPPVASPEWLPQRGSRCLSSLLGPRSTVRIPKSRMNTEMTRNSLFTWDNVLEWNHSMSNNKPSLNWIKATHLTNWVSPQDDAKSPGYLIIPEVNQ